ncbi:MAG: AAA family ATPase [Bdellovibrionales bacterium]
MFSDITLTLYEMPDTQDGVIHLDPSDMRALGVAVGDLIGVEGGHLGHLLVKAAFLGDHNQRLARVSSLTARNLGSLSGQKVRLLPERVKLPVAERVMLQAQDGIDQVHLIAREKQLVNHCMKRAVRADDELLFPTLDRFPLRAKVAGVVPSDAAQIGSSTVFAVMPDTASGDQALPSLGGLREVYRTCQKLTQARFSQGVAHTARSLLLMGPEGCGKAKLVERLAKESKVAFYGLDAYHLINQWIERGTVGLEEKLADVSRSGPAFLLLDHLEALAQGEGSALAGATHALVEQIGSLLDELPMNPNVVVFGVLAGDPSQIARLSSHFDFRLQVDAPNRWGRREVLHCATKGFALADDVDLDELATISSGMTARDLTSLAQAASCLATSSKVGEKDFTAAYCSATPSASSDIICDIPSVLWNDVAGLDDIKQVLSETLTWSLHGQEVFAAAGVHPPRSILLSGGQGTGKTSLVRALAAQLPIHYVEISCPAMMARDQKNNTNFLVESFSLARRKAPCLVFFDNIDVLFEPVGGDADRPHQHPFVAQLMAELDALPLLSGVVVVAATNRPDRLTSEMLRPGRFDFAMTLPMPDGAVRKKILQIHARKLPLSADIDFDQLADSTQGMSPAEIVALCNRVGLLAIRQVLGAPEGGLPPVVQPSHFEQVLRGRKG